jgi:hypothetical protein
MTTTDPNARPWWAATLPLPSGYTFPLPRIVPVKLAPRGYVRAANRLAHEFAKEPALRVLAAQICETVEDIHREGPLAIAQWIREHIRYMQEAGEVIQGPFHTLGARLGDCDDLVTLWACLCRSVGLDAVLVGLCPQGRKTPPFAHAVGMAGGLLYELTDDRQYTMRGEPSQILMRWPARTWGYYWNPTLNKGRWMAGGLGDLTGQLEGLGGEFAGSLDGVPLPDVLTKGIAAATSAVGAGTAAATTAATLGLSAAAVPIIGWIVGGAALLGVGVGALVKRVKQKRSVLTLTNQTQQWIDTIVSILEPGELEPQVRARLLELLPAMSGTRGEVGSEKRRTGSVTIASLTDRSPPSGTTWADGSTRRRAGLASSVGTKGKGERIARQIRASARTLAEGMQTLNLIDRRRAFNLATATFLSTPDVFTGLRAATVQSTPQSTPQSASKSAASSSTSGRVGPIAPIRRPLLQTAPQIRTQQPRSAPRVPWLPIAIGASVAVALLVRAQ